VVAATVLCTSGYIFVRLSINSVYISIKYVQFLNEIYFYSMLLENIKIAVRSIKSNLLRSLLTIMIIMVGIAALVGILTAIDTMLYSLNDNFSSIGANSFKITPAYESLKSNRHGRRKRGRPVQR